MKTLMPQRPVPAPPKAKPGDIVHTKWEEGNRKTELLIGPDAESDVELDCEHWAEILEALGGENQL